MGVGAFMKLFFCKVVNSSPMRQLGKRFVLITLCLSLILTPAARLQVNHLGYDFITCTFRVFERLILFQG